MKTFHPIAIAAAALLMSSPLALAQTATSSTQNGSNAQLSSADRTYLEQDARGAAYELQISQLAAQKASSPQVRQYAEMVAKDHENYNQKLQQLAEQDGVTVNNTPDQKDQAKINQLEQLNGSAFDKTYVQQMKQVNQSDIKKEQKEADSTQNSGNQAIHPAVQADGPEAPARCGELVRQRLQQRLSRGLLVAARVNTLAARRERSFLSIGILRPSKLQADRHARHLERLA